MGLDDPTHKYSNSSSGGGGGGGGASDDGKSNSKKLKQKKVPQRGLGVAQLEKIRLEEQQKDAAVIQVHNHNHNHTSSNNTNNNNNSPSMSVIQASRHNHPFPSSTNSLYRPASSSIPTNLDCLNTAAAAAAAANASLPKSTIPLNVGGGGEIGWRSVPGLGQVIWPGLWTDENSLEMERHNNSMMIQDQKGGLPTYHPPNRTSNLAVETVNWPPSSTSFVQRTQQLPPPPPPPPQQRPSSSSSTMVKVPYGISSSPALNFHHHPMEPPSNQSFYGTSTNDYASFWPEEDKMVGMKRPCPFSIDNPSAPSFRIRYPPPPPHPPTLTLTQPVSLPPPPVAAITRSDDSAALPNLDSSSNLVFRENRHSVVSLHDIRKQIQVGRVDNGDFLSLAPPSTASPNHTPDMAPDMEYPPCQGGEEEMGSRQRQQFYNFFPCPMAPSYDPALSMHEVGGRCSSSGGGGGGGGGNEEKKIDLDLKL